MFFSPRACTGRDIRKMILISIYGVDYIISVHLWVHACGGFLYKYNGGGIKEKDKELRELRVIYENDHFLKKKSHVP